VRPNPRYQKRWIAKSSNVQTRAIKRIETPHHLSERFNWSNGFIATLSVSNKFVIVGNNCRKLSKLCPTAMTVDANIMGKIIIAPKTLTRTQKSYGFGCRMKLFMSKAPYGSKNAQYKKSVSDADINAKIWIAFDDIEATIEVVGNKIMSTTAVTGPRASTKGCRTGAMGRPLLTPRHTVVRFIRIRIAAQSAFLKRAKNLFKRFRPFVQRTVHVTALSPLYNA